MFLTFYTKDYIEHFFKLKVNFDLLVVWATPAAQIWVSLGLFFITFLLDVFTDRKQKKRITLESVQNQWLSIVAPITAAAGRQAEVALSFSVVIYYESKNILSKCRLFFAKSTCSRFFLARDVPLDTEKAVLTTLPKIFDSIRQKTWLNFFKKKPENVSFSRSKAVLTTLPYKFCSKSEKKDKVINVFKNNSPKRFLSSTRMQFWQPSRKVTAASPKKTMNFQVFKKKSPRKDIYNLKSSFCWMLKLTFLKNCRVQLFHEVLIRQPLIEEDFSFS